MAIVYLHRRKDNNEVFYIGASGDKVRPYSKYGRNKDWNKIVNKFGFIVEIFKEGLTIKEARVLEKKLISIHFDTLVNQRRGGGNPGKVLSEKTKEKISKSQSGSNGYWYGKVSPRKNKKHSEESKIKMSIANSGENNPHYGKLGEEHPAFGHVHTENAKNKISKNRLNKVWVNNGLINKAVHLNEIPEGFVRGMVKRKK